MTATLEAPAETAPEVGAPCARMEDEIEMARRPAQRPGTGRRTQATRPSPPQPVGVERIVLTGFMGSGKTTTGRALAERLGWRFVDLDAEIERREQQSIGEIFATRGEASFRHAETAALVGVLGQREVVLALGGGAPEQLGNRLLLEQTPRTAVVYLSAPLEELVARCEREDSQAGQPLRPLLGEAEQRFQHRRPLYERLATHPIETSGRALDSVVERVLAALEQRPLASSRLPTSQPESHAAE